MRISDWSSDVCSSDLISSGSLSSALMALGREAKVQIVFTPDSVEGRKSKGVRGRMTVDAALTRLLEGSGLSFRKVNGGSYVVSGPSKESYEIGRASCRERVCQYV